MEILFQSETSRRHDNEAPQLEDLIPRPLLITNEIDEDQEDENIYSVKNQETGSGLFFRHVFILFIYLFISVSSNADNRIESSLSKSLYSEFSFISFLFTFRFFKFFKLFFC